MRPTVTATPLSAKLQLKANQRARILNAPEQVRPALEELPADFISAAELTGQVSCVLVFVNNTDDLVRFGLPAVEALVDDGLLWFAYQKKSRTHSSDLNRDAGWQVVMDRGFRPVRQIAIDDVWSAIRFRPLDRVVSRKKPT